jgi:hemerythrin-like domain-containing protein
MNASHMAIVHNVIIRGYNSIYQQAPHVSSEDVPDFIGYSKAWIEMVLGHHHSEEEVLFSMIEAGAGIPGLMDTDKEEHGTANPDSRDGPS